MDGKNLNQMVYDGIHNQYTVLILIYQCNPTAVSLLHHSSPGTSQQRRNGTAEAPWIHSDGSLPTAIGIEPTKGF